MKISRYKHASDTGGIGGERVRVSFTYKIRYDRFRPFSRGSSDSFIFIVYVYDLMRFSNCREIEL
jgi:hypothetical protein